MTEGAGAQGRGIGGISHRAAALVARSVCGLSFVLTALSLLLLALNLESPGVHIFTYWAGQSGKHWTTLISLRSC